MTTPTEPDPVAATDFGTGLGAAADRLRESARWLVLTSGAVAAVVFAGVGLSRFGDLDPDTDTPEFWWALAGAAAALVGAFAALLTTMSLAAASTVTAQDLRVRPDGRHRALRSARDIVATDPLLEPWRTGVAGDDPLAAFIEATAGANREFHQQLEAWRADRATQASTTLLTRAATHLDVLRRIERSVLAMASLVRLQHRFRSARWALAAELLVAAAGGIVFVVATGAPATEDLPREVTRAIWDVPADRRPAVQQSVGANCALPPGRLPVLVLGSQGDGKEREVAIDPQRSCTPVRLVVPAGELAAVDP